MVRVRSVVVCCAAILLMTLLAADEAAAQPAQTNANTDANTDANATTNSAATPTLPSPEIAVARSAAAHDDGASSSATAAPSPWIEQAPSRLVDRMWQHPPADHRLAAGLTLGGLYAGFTTWTYFAWYRKHKPLSEFRWGGDGLFDDRSYAGGADKLGHMWATMSLGRAGTELLHQWGGYKRLTANIVSTALAETLFFLIEVKDGFYYELSLGDLAGNTMGAALGFAFSQWPRLDELFDFRVEYWPSAQYRRQFEHGNINIAEDYSGETYLAAFHLGAIHALRDHKYGLWSRFVDVTVGFGSRGYKPTNPGVDYPHEQHLSFGLSLNAQGLFDWLLAGRKSRAAHKTRVITHGIFEVFNVPFSSVPLIEYIHTATGPIDMGGA